MNHGTLVRHPAPKPTESLLGYVLRLVQENGYTNSGQLFSLADISYREANTTRVNVAQLARVTNRHECQLEPLSYYSAGMNPHQCRLLGHALITSDLRIRTPQICPECLVERGFIEAHFELTRMTGCPVHRKVLLSGCPKCLQRLRWSRPGLLECQCGASLFDPDRASLSPFETDLLDIFRRKVLGLPGALQYSSGFPARDLQNLSLRSLVQVTNKLGRSYLKTQGETGRLESQHIVHYAAKVLADWPQSFFRFLGMLREGKLGSSTFRITQQGLSGFYGFVNQYIEPKESADFLRIALNDYSTSSGGRGLSDRKLFQRAGTQYSARFITISEFAQRYSLAEKTAARYLSSEMIPCIQTGHGPLIDSRAATLARHSPGRVYRLDKVAKMIRMPVKVLRSLMASGDYEINHRPKNMPGLHELDTQSFVRKLMSLSPVQKCDHSLLEGFISVQTIIDARNAPYGPMKVKANVIRLLLARELPVTGCVDGTIGGLIFSEHALRLCLRNGRNLRETATQLHCTVEFVPPLVELGLLRRKKIGRNWWITEESIIEFQQRYVCLASLAKMTGFHSSTLIRHCNQCGIELLLVKSSKYKWRQAFIRIGDEPTLLSFLSQPGLLVGVAKRTE